jgi:hypothetical protein
VPPARKKKRQKKRRVSREAIIVDHTSVIINRNEDATSFTMHVQRGTVSHNSNDRLNSKFPGSPSKPHSYLENQHVRGIFALEEVGASSTWEGYVFKASLPTRTLFRQHTSTIHRVASWLLQNRHEEAQGGS